MNLLQVITTAPDSLNVTTAPESVSLWDLILAGGPMMIPIFIMSLLAIYIFVERYLTVQRASRTPNQFVEKIKNLITAGDISGARLLCSQTETPIARMIEKGLARIGSPLKNIEVSIENVGKVEINKLEKNLSLLATISGAAPMVGFLGTVTGMIKAFIAIAQEEGTVSPKLLSSGIYEAMITTASGLIVGIIAYLGYNYLITQIQKIIHRMEYSSIDFIDLLQEPR